MRSFSPLCFLLSPSAIGTMVDGVIIGQYLGVDSIAAFGIVSPLMIAFALGGAIVSAGARNRFTRLVGCGEVRRAQGAICIDAIAESNEKEILMNGGARYRILDVGNMQITYQDPWEGETTELYRGYIKVELLAP